MRKTNWWETCWRYWWVGWLLLLIAKIVYSLWINVPSLNQDEAALLLNARFIAQAGHDEWGNWWPLAFKSFGDFKLPGYIYLTAMLGQIIGWSSWTVRLQSWLAALFLPVVSYQLIKNWLDVNTARWSVLLLIASPWTWHYGSVGFEAHLALTLLIAVFWLLSTVKQFGWRLILAMAIFLLAMLTYNSPLLLAPLVLFYWLWKFRMRPRPLKTWLAGVGLWLLVFGLALAVTLPVSLQKQGISIFSDPQIITSYALFRQSFSSAVWQKLLGNQYVYFALIIFKNWLASWQASFLVLKGGGNPWHGIPFTGHLSWLAWIWLPIGMAALVKFKKWWILFFGLVSLLPAVITVDVPHATRSLLFFWVLAVVAGFALQATLASLLKHRSLWRVIFITLLLVSFLSWFIQAAWLWHHSGSPRWHTGLISTLQRIPEGGKPIYVVDDHGVLYVYVAQAKQIGYDQFINSVERSNPNTAGLVRVDRLDRYYFVFEKKDAPFDSIVVFPNLEGEWDMIGL